MLVESQGFDSGGRLRETSNKMGRRQTSAPLFEHTFIHAHLNREGSVLQPLAAGRLPASPG